MGEVVSLAVRRAQKQARARVDAERILHPSLRWVAGGQWFMAHARSGDRALCGTLGPLVLASPGVPLCRTCFPDGGAQRTDPDNP